MRIFADIKLVKKLIDDISALESGNVEVHIQAPIHVTITASDGRVVLDTTISVNT